MLSLRLDLIEIIGYLAKGKTLEETREKFDLPSTRAVKDRVKAFEKELGHPIFNLHKSGNCFVWELASDAAREALLTLYGMGRDIALAKHLCKAFGEPPDRTKPSGFARTNHLMEAQMLIRSNAEEVGEELGIPSYEIKRGLYVLEDYFGAKLLEFFKSPGYICTKTMRDGVQELFHGIECYCASLDGCFKLPPSVEATHH